MERCEISAHDLVFKHGDLNQHIAAVALNSMMNATECLLGRVGEHLAGPFPRGSLNGGLKAAIVQCHVVVGSAAKIQSHNGEVMSAELGGGVGHFTAIPRGLNGDVQAQGINDES